MARVKPSSTRKISRPNTTRSSTSWRRSGAGSAGPPPAKVRSPLSTPRITPITQRDQVPAEHRAVFDAIAEGRGGVRAPFTILMYSPVLGRRMLDVRSYLRFTPRVKADVRELAVIATAREKDCPYVWAAHAPAARREGAGDAAVAAVRDRRDLAGLAPADRDAVDYVRQLLRTNHVTESMFDRLRSQYGGALARRAHLSHRPLRHRHRHPERVRGCSGARRRAAAPRVAARTSRTRPIHSRPADLVFSTA